MTCRLRSLATGALAVSLAACGGAGTTATPPATGAPTAAPVSQAAPFHPIPADSVVVSGTAACDFSMDGVDPEGGAEGGWLVVCALDMSDPRVSGTETHDRLRFFTGGEGGLVWVAEEAVITNPGGTWRGSAQAADIGGLPSGEAHYSGEGAYDGLEFHYYFCGPDEADGPLVRGWISGGG